MTRTCIFTLLLLSWMNAIAQRSPAIKQYGEAIRNFTSTPGLFTVHTHKDTVYFEIPDSVLGRDIQVVERVAAGGGAFAIYPGQEYNQQTIFFDKDAPREIRLRYDLLINEADSGSALDKGVSRANVAPVYLTFPILAFGPGGKSYVIDVSKPLHEGKLIRSNGDVISLNLNTINDLTWVRLESVHAYPQNVNVETTWNGHGVGASGPSNDLFSGTLTGPCTLTFRTSFIELPEVPMQRRMFDPRVGYFTDGFFSFGDGGRPSEKKEFIARWRLEPKPEDVDKWKRGELVEPAKPIVYYIDPATPKQWRKYLIMGVDDWQKAFEQAGFKNAIIGKEWPEDDTSMHLDDARYSFIDYLPSWVENAAGPNVHDPRSGEIIQSHIWWYHNVMELVHNWFMVQAGATDSNARRPVFSEELMGQLIRFVSSHEVGHTLGLRHNFGSSSLTPVDSLRSRTWLEKHGHTASIMDYARFDYVAQPEDHIPEKDLFPHIGEYDRWAIEWGYKYSGAASAAEDHIITDRWITERLAANPLLWWGDGEGLMTDPRRETEDLGDDAAKAGDYAIKNLQRIVPNLLAWTHEEGGLYTGFQETYGQVEMQYFQLLQHVLKYIGGEYTTVRSEDTGGPVSQPVPKEKGLEALRFLNDQLFNTPRWLFDPAVIGKLNTDDVTKIAGQQVSTLRNLFKIDLLNRLNDHVIRYGAANTLTVGEYVDAIHHGIWRELEDTSGDVLVADPLRRVLQNAYVDDMYIALLNNDVDEQGNDPSESDAISFLKEDAVTLERQLSAALLRCRDVSTRLHLQDLKERLISLWKKSKTTGA